MPEPVYRELLEVTKSRRGPYAGLDIPGFYEMAAALFTPEEAALNNARPRSPVTAAEVARTLGRGEAQTAAGLEALADKGLCATFVLPGERRCQGVPCMPGIFEYQLMSGRTGNRGIRIARLIHACQQAYTVKARAAKPGA